MFLKTTVVYYGPFLLFAEVNRETTMETEIEQKETEPKQMTEAIAGAARLYRKGNASFVDPCDRETDPLKFSVFRDNQFVDNPKEQRRFSYRRMN